MTWESTVEVTEVVTDVEFTSGGVTARVRQENGEWVVTLPEDPALTDAGPRRAYNSKTEAFDAAWRIVQACVTAAEMRCEADRAVAAAFREAPGQLHASIAEATP